ncbi:group 1 glycosyl transferase [Clostridium bornimense]|uniref:Group 1 glycosyl transferase n=1 Tax=Clostridium bornimense TaxID=1216932 RepID=W6RWE0_9CLOT|nr:glycosyltransferase family 4 protein [Clostridium bornimense]CDM67939.1 group 1 glycosyl transferase [Clostridium bornimense]
MNILYISHERNLGGASIALLELIDEMLLMKQTVYVLVVGKGKFYEELKKRDVKIIEKKYYVSMYRRVNWKSRVKCILRNIQNCIVAYQVSKEIKKYDIDLIHTNTSVIYIGAMIGKISHIPHIFHIREFDTAEDRKYPISPKIINKFIENNSVKIITISKGLYRESIKKFNKDKVIIIYDGISDIYKYKTKRNATINKDEFNILILGYISSGKGQKDGVLAVINLYKKGYRNVKLTLAGNFEQKYKEEIDALVVENNIENNIRILKFTKDVVALHEEADLELNCSRSEGFGRTTIEAMYNKKPIIGVDCVATNELIVDGFNGFLYKAGDIDELSKKIEYLICNYKERSIMGKNGCEYAINEFSSKKNAHNIFNLYKKII